MKNRLPALALLLALSAAALSPGCATVAAAIPVALVAVQAGELAVSMIESFSDDYFRARPNPDERAKVEAAIAKARTALAAITSVLGGAEAATTGQLDAAFADFKAAYEDLVSLVGYMGVHVASGAPRATPGGGLSVPPASEILRSVRK